ncbi:MAG: methyltransferase [Labedaea sp.]
MGTLSTTAPSSSADLLRLATGFWDARALAVAVELDLFTVLAKAPATLPELCQVLGLHPRPAEALLNGLAALGVLELAGDHYRNGAAAATWLDRAQPAYLGSLSTLAGSQFPLWSRLNTLLVTGQPQTGGHTELDGYSDEAALRRFVESMDVLSAPCGAALAATFDWSGRTTLVDLGGGRGNVVATVLGAHPHLRGASFDLPDLRPLFDEHVTRLGLADRMRFHAGDFFRDELPPADVYLLGHLLADLDDERCEQLVARVADALPPGGTLLVYDAMIDPDRPQTWRNWLLMLNLQLVSPGGTGYRTKDCQSWLTRAGLVEVGACPLVDHETLVTGVKPRP